MAMPVMQVRVVRMPVHQAGVPVSMGVRLAGRHIRPVIMLVMLIVSMTMFMFHRLVAMFVVMPFGQMQP